MFEYLLYVLNFTLMVKDNSKKQNKSGRVLVYFQLCVYFLTGGSRLLHKFKLYFPIFVSF